MTVQLFTHSNIWVEGGSTATRTHANAIVVVHGTIEFVGEEAEAEGFATARAREIGNGQGVAKTALRGAVLLPGFHDAHIHLGAFASERDTPDLRGARSHQECVTRLRAWAQARPNRDRARWVTGGRWDQNLWPAGDTALHRSTLDEIFGQQPVTLGSLDGHTQWVNSVALQLAGITDDTPNPDGGRIERDDRGEATGILRETAMNPVTHLAEGQAAAQLREQLEVAQRDLHALGITQVTDFDPEAVTEALTEMRDAGTLALRVHKGVQVFDLEQALAEGRTTGYGDEWITTGPLKLFADGALGSLTAHLSEAYADDPHNCGMAVTAAAELRRRVAAANRAGIAVAVHAIGDRAVTTVLDAFEAAQTPGITNRVEHAQHIRPVDLPRFEELGVVASMQPIHATSDYPLSQNLLGDRDVAHYPWRSLLSHGATVVFGSDAPIETPSIIAAVHAAVTRENRDGEPAGGREPQERIGVTEAIRAYTETPAEAAGLTRVGKIAPGCYADFVILDRDPRTTPAREIADINVVETIVAGQTVYRA